jgi:hypothetical protein
LNGWQQKGETTTKLENNTKDLISINVFTFWINKSRMKYWEISERSLLDPWA